MGFFKPNISKLKEKNDIRGLVNALRDKREQKVDTASGGKEKEETSDLAAEALIELGDQRAASELIKIVDQAPDTYEFKRSKSELGASETARKAIEILGKLGDRSAIPALVRALSKQVDPFTVSGTLHPAAKALGQIGDPAAIPPLVDLLASPDPTLRKNAIQALGQLRSREAVPALIDLLDDSEACNTAIRALGAIGDKSVIPQLAKLAEKPDPSTRHAVFVALIMLQDQTGLAMPAAIETLAIDSYLGLESVEQTYALHYLCGLNKPEVVPHLLASLPALANPELRWKITNASESNMEQGYTWRRPFEDCVEAIGRLGSKECIPRLEEVRRTLDEQDRDIVDKMTADLKNR